MTDALYLARILVLPVPEVELHANFFDLGMGSVMITEFVKHLESASGHDPGHDRAGFCHTTDH